MIKTKENLIKLFLQHNLLEHILTLKLAEIAMLCQKGKLKIEIFNWIDHISTENLLILTIILHTIVSE